MNSRHRSGQYFNYSDQKWRHQSHVANFCYPWAFHSNLKTQKSSPKFDKCLDRNIIVLNNSVNWVVIVINSRQNSQPFQNHDDNLNTPADRKHKQSEDVGDEEFLRMCFYQDWVLGHTWSLHRKSGTLFNWKVVMPSNSNKKYFITTHTKYGFQRISEEFKLTN